MRAYHFGMPSFSSLFVNHSKKLPFSNLLLGIFSYICNPNTISKNKMLLQNKDIVEKQKWNLVFVDSVYKLWFAQEYI